MPRRKIKEKVEEAKRGELTDLPIRPIPKLKETAEKVLPGKKRR